MSWYGLAVQQPSDQSTTFQWFSIECMTEQTIKLPSTLVTAIHIMECMITSNTTAN